MAPKAPPVPKKSGGSLATTIEVECWRQRLKSETKITQSLLEQDIKKAGDLNRKNDILHYYKAKDVEPRPFLEFTLDKLKEDQKFDPKAKEDTMYPAYLRHKEGFKSSRPVRTSQAYGWYAPVDQPKYGFERTRICHESFMDKSHL